MENKLPTAEDYFMQKTDILTMCGNKQKVCKAMIEFASIHVTEALNAASESVRTITDEWGHYEGIDKDSILNAYPLDNIK